VEVARQVSAVLDLAVEIIADQLLCGNPSARLTSSVSAAAAFATRWAFSRSVRNSVLPRVLILMKMSGALRPVAYDQARDVAVI
jgi:hypothetical protein